MSINLFKITTIFNMSSNLIQNIYIHIIYISNLQLRITAFVREREQSRFKKNIEGARGSSEGARESTMKQCRDAAGRSLN